MPNKLALDFLIECDRLALIERYKNATDQDKPRYGFKVGDLVTNQVPVEQQSYFVNGVYDPLNRYKTIPPGTLLIVVAIAAKVSYTSDWKLKNEPTRYDNRDYFYNAVIYSEGLLGPRIRENFVTIRKVKED